MDLPPCADAFAEVYAVPRVVIEAVAEQEGGRPGLVVENDNGTVDVGIMQINSAWFEPGNPVDLGERGITLARVRDDACLNIAIGTWILNRYHARMGGHWGRAISAYNAGPGNWRAGIDYAHAVNARIQRRWSAYRGAPESAYLKGDVR